MRPGLPRDEGAEIRIIRRDITQADTDAIVNAANPQMLGGGGVDGAIHRAAGPQLLEQCKKIPATRGIRCPTGEARITPAGQLKCRYVIHTVGPRYHEDRNPAALLHAAYANSLRLAQQYACASVAFPAISCGVYGYPPHAAAQIALAACAARADRALRIEFHLFSDEMVAIWRAAQRP